MNTQSLVTITSASGMLQALRIQTTLELAGIPVTLVASRTGSYLDVRVPAECAGEARDLLYPEVRSGEIFMALRA